MHRLFIRSLLFVVGTFCVFLAKAHSEQPSAVRFIENGGQWDSHIQYAANLPSGRVFIEANQLTFVFQDLSDLHDRWLLRAPDQSPEFPLATHAFTLTFGDQAQEPTIVPAEKEEYYHNYFVGNDPAKWASEVGLYESLRLEDIYPGIDFVLHGEGTGLKYDFEVEAGADPSQIQLVFEGLEGLSLRNGDLVMTTSVNEIVDAAPIAWQQDTVDCVYQIDGNRVSFAFEQPLDVQQDLVIDPTLIFSTFTGSQANNFGFSSTYDEDGNLYAGGIAYDQGYPVTLGAYQTQFVGGFDISISKFTSTGNHIWSTFIGGAGADQPHSMITNRSGDLFIYGRSLSQDYPVTQGAYDVTLGGGYDIIVSRVSSDGSTLQGSSYIGGNENDGMNITNSYVQSGLKYNYGDDARGEIVLDDDDNVYIASCTRSPNFPVSPGALSTALGGQQDACVFKMNSDMSSLTWSTYLGGSSDDAAYSLKVDGSFQVFVTGGTRSQDFPTTTGVLAQGPLGDVDGFIAHLFDDGSGLIASTYVGTAAYNQCYFLEMDKDEDIYVVGQKIGAWPIVPSTIWRTPAGGGQFLLKLTNDLSTIVYSTEFGTGNNTVNFSPTAFLVDVCEYVYVSGWGGATNFTGTTNGLPLTPDAIQSTTDGSDLYIIVLQPDIIGVDFATYLGGTQSNEHVDGGTSRFNKRAEIYQSVCAGCQGNSDWPTTPGAFSSTNNSPGCNLACFKLQLNLPGVVADFRPDPDSAGCAPQLIQFDNLSLGGNQYWWDFGDGSPTSTAFNPSHTYTLPGEYEVTLVAVDSNSCNISDTARRIIQIYAVPQAIVTPDTNVCDGQSVVLSAAGGQSYSWSPNLYLNTSTGSTVLSNPQTNVTYEVIVTNPGGCADTTTVDVGVLPLPTAATMGDTLICPGDSALLMASGGQSYTWSPGATVFDPNAAVTTAGPLISTQYIVQVFSNDGCIDQDTVNVDVSTIQANAGPDANLCIGDTMTLNGSGGLTYLWSPPADLSATGISAPDAFPLNSTTFYLTVTDQYGCESVDSVDIAVQPLPIVDAGQDVLICDNDMIQLTATGALQYLWSPGFSLNDPTLASPTASPTTPTVYQVIGTDGFGCQNGDSVTVDVIPAPIAVAMGGGTICEDSSIQLFASGGNSYVWNPGMPLDDPTSATPIATLQNSTIFVLTAFATNGCDDTDTVEVNVTPTPVIDASGSEIICLGESGRLLVSGANGYVWSNGETGAVVSVMPEVSQVYSVVGYVDGCPSLPDSVAVEVDTLLPTAAFFATPDSGWIPLTTIFVNQSQNASVFEWDFGDGDGSSSFSPEHMYTDTGRFPVELIAINGNDCRDTAYSKVIVGADFSVFVPNAFTPNGDGLNDYFNTPWFGVKEYHVMLFDRWGMLIYESFDPDFKWYGIFKGNDCQEGVYTYVIEARGWVGEKVKKAGTVTLLR